MREIVLASRGSKLALVQANMVKELLEQKGASVVIKTMKTGGDRDQTSPLQKIGGKGLFVKEIEFALLSGEADIAVHSGKDLPYLLLDGMTIAANPAPADPRDCLVTNKGSMLPENPLIGTGSPRRAAELKRLMPGAAFKEIRGNVDTRLRKLQEGQYDGIFLAKAGMDRLGLDLSEFDVRVFETDEVIPAPSQGILAVECREQDEEIVNILRSISDPIAQRRFMAERKIFCALEADCSVAIGVHVRVADELDISLMFEGRRIRHTCREENLDAWLESIRNELLASH